MGWVTIKGRHVLIEEETLYRGEGTYNKNGHFYSTNREFAQQFTQTGQAKEVKVVRIPKNKIWEHSGSTYAGDVGGVDAALKEAKKQNYAAIRLDEGKGQPKSVYVFDKSVLKRG